MRGQTTRQRPGRQASGGVALVRRRAEPSGAALGADKGAEAPPDPAVSPAGPLARPRACRRLARALERALTEAARPPGLRPDPQVARRRQAVSGAAGELSTLIARLRSPEPTTADGLAQARLLLAVPDGPLHRGAVEPDLRAALKQVIAKIDPATAAASARTAGADVPAGTTGP